MVHDTKFKTMPVGLNSFHTKIFDYIQAVSIDKTPQNYSMFDRSYRCDPFSDLVFSSPWYDMAVHVCLRAFCPNSVYLCILRFLFVSFTSCPSLYHFRSVSHYSMNHAGVLCHTMPYYATLCRAMPGYATLCHTMPHYATLCHTMPHYAIVCQVCHRVQNDIGC